MIKQLASIILVCIAIATCTNVVGLEEPWASMPEEIQVIASTNVPIWFCDESGCTRIPCMATNPVKYGMPFQIAASSNIDGDKSGIAYLHVDAPSPTTHRFATTLEYPTPYNIRGRYSGIVSINPQSKIRIWNRRR